MLVVFLQTLSFFFNYFLVLIESVSFNYEFVSFFMHFFSCWFYNLFFEDVNAFDLFLTQFKNFKWHLFLQFLLSKSAGFLEIKKLNYFCKLFIVFMFNIIFIVFVFILFGFFGKGSFENKFMALLDGYLFLYFCSACFFGICFYVSSISLQQPIAGYFFNNLLSVNNYVLFCSFIISLTGVCFFTISYPFLKKNATVFNFDYLHTIALVLFMLIILNFSNNLVLTVMCIEAISFCLYYLAVVNKNCFFSLEAGLKYFVLGGYSSGLLILGASLLHISFLTSHFNEINIIITQAAAEFELINFAENFLHYASNAKPYVFSLFVLFAFLSFIIGFLFKLGAAPFHFWVSDVYEGAPLPTTFFFATAVKVGIFFHFIKLLGFVFKQFDFFWSPLFQVIAVISLLVGTLSMYKQMKIKRFFAFSSITHTAFILIALSANTTFSFTYALFYLINYLFLSILLFWVLLMYYSNDRTSKELIFFSDFLRVTGVTFKNQYFNFLMLFIFISVLFSFAGIPPFIGFFMKFNVFMSVLKYQTHAMFLIFIMLITSVLSAYNYLKIIKLLLIETATFEQNKFSSFLLGEENLLLAYMLTIIGPLILLNLLGGLYLTLILTFLLKLVYCVKFPFLSILLPLL